jgi:fumarylacetoacetate (FAA) hydrolase
VLLGPTDPIALGDPAWGLDFESEVCVILGDVAPGTRAADAARHVRLVALANDVTLRHLVPDELAKGFGFFQSKPATAFSPFAVTPDELGDAWRGGRLHLAVRTTLNGVLVGDPAAGDEMHFSFFDLVEHVARTRGFTAGTILGSGTVSNADRARGVSCLAERRTLEILDGGKPVTPFLAAGDRVRIEVLDAAGWSPFGAIENAVVAR